ncbi:MULTISPECIES: hypothetical protein [Microcystis]|uniref:Uncharacterized protein n=1 Tax=Microcystis panniformis FACHB-1757 TaxID=1638788 RepID=A0A0K1S663_9CHRO|nr:MULTISPECIES: hypothetical protein [Microcystis]AKV69550.1 hypothetical protein VL20_4651 [Microcystis panniformis FACHB-1757]MDB9409211.1 hypothetical protein [Microcystis aeruginosa CS-558/01A06]
MNSLQTLVERENLGQFLLENLQDITDKLNQIVTDSDRIILDNLLSSHAKLITCPIELKPLRGNDRHV